MSVKVLAVGDVCGEPGLAFLEKRLKPYRQENGIDFVVVNGENANVVGITPRQADQIFRAGADVITLGNHTWTRTELRPYLDERRKILRPANFAPQCPGRGIAAYSTILLPEHGRLRCVTYNAAGISSLTLLALPKDAVAKAAALTTNIRSKGDPVSAIPGTQLVGEIFEVDNLRFANHAIDGLLIDMRRRAEGRKAGWLRDIFDD